jgi:hypothetical protein
MAKHKIVAWKLTERQGEVVLEALTASPRGTRIPFASVRFEAARLTPQAFATQLESEIGKILQTAEGPQ